tara:strand:+ start:81957 stop:82634 length:678 start_codon:yes stop_codon:yes gene_type:complete
MLPQPQSDLWNAYLETENLRFRSERNIALDRFLDSFATLPLATQREWALQFVTDPDFEALTIRMPLFRRVLLPLVRTAVDDRVPRCAHWLSKHAHLIYKCRDTIRDLPDTYTEHGLLLTALDHDETDDNSRRRLVELIANQMEYTLHELPAGVLYGHNGATVSECREMQAELDDFVVHATRLGVTDTYADLISDCRFHDTQYGKYLADRRGVTSYADYLSQFSDA